MFEALRIGWIGQSGFDGPQNLLDNHIIAVNFWETLKVYSVSMAISVVLGIPIGLAMGGSKWVDAIMSPYVWTFSALPRIAIFPVLVLLPFVGIGRGSPIKHIIIVLTAVFPIIINTWAGVKTTDPSLLSAARVFGASKLQLYVKVVLPYTLPFVVSGIQLSLGRGLIGAVVAEFLSGANTRGGLGWLVFRSAAAFNAPLTYASFFTLAIFALLLVQGTRSFEARVAPWRTARSS
jgi:NitT/TauT family transport system permease protein